MRKCLYCLRSDGKFTSVEHMIPRGLGNEQYVLRKGIVCNECNNGVLSQLDEILLEFDPIKFMRAFHGAKSRTDKEIIYKNSAFSMKHTSPDHILIEADRATKAIVTREDGFSLNPKSGKRMTPEYSKQLARALYKIGLGIVYIDLGRKVAMSRRFNEVRKIILGTTDFSGYLAFNKHSTLEHTANIRHWGDRVVEGKTLSLFQFYYYGIDVYFDMERRSFDSSPEVTQDILHILRF